MNDNERIQTALMTDKLAGLRMAADDIEGAMRTVRNDPQEQKMTENQIKHMVDQFLRWKLPADFGPDGGISFDPISNRGNQYESRREPVGTNLLTASQADAMIRHMLDGLPE